MAGVEIGTAYVSLAASASGIGASLAGQMAGPATAAGTMAGGRMAGAMGGALASGAKLAAGGVAAVGAAAVAAGVGLFKLGDTFDQAYDRIRVGTGATGEDLEALKDSFKGVFSSFPTDSASAAAAIDTLNTKLGLTGEPLETLSGQMLELSRISGTDVQGNLDAASSVINNWGVAVGDQEETMDALFRVTQATGVEFSQLSGDLAQNGAALRAVGFSLEDSAALLGGLEKAGVSATEVMPAFQRAMATAAEEGITAKDALQGTWDTIANAPNETAAAQAALETFGTRAGPRLAAMIREGQLSFEELSASVTEGGDTILGVGDETQSFGEQWQKMSNRVKVALEPLATKVFTAVGNAVEKLAPILEQGIAWFTRMTEVFQEGGLSALVDELGATFEQAWPKIQTALGSMLSSLGQWVADMAPVVGEQLVAWGKALVEWIVPQIPPLLERLGLLLSDLGVWVLETGLPALVEKLKEWGQALIEWIGPMILPLLGELAKLQVRLGRWFVEEALPFIIGKLVEWSVAFYGWVIELAQQMPGKLWELAQAIGAWMVNEAVPWLEEKLVEWGAAFLAWASETGGKIPGWIWDAIKNSATTMASIGVELVRGIWEGIDSAKDWLFDQIGGFASAIGDAVKNPLGIFSPSRVMIGYGKNVSEGLAVGIAENAHRVEEEMAKLAAKVRAEDGSKVPQSFYNSRPPSGPPPGWIRAEDGSYVPPSFYGLPRFHDGGTFRAPTRGGEGLALLRDGEVVLTPDQASRGTAGTVTVPLVLQLDGRTVMKSTTRLQVANERARR